MRVCTRTSMVRGCPIKPPSGTITRLAPLIILTQTHTHALVHDHGNHDDRPARHLHISPKIACGLFFSFFLLFYFLFYFFYYFLFLSIFTFYLFFFTHFSSPYVLTSYRPPQTHKCGQNIYTHGHIIIIVFQEFFAL